MLKKSGIILAMAMACLLTALPAAADEIAEQIEQGLKFYNKGKISKAIGELEFALAQMKQKKAEAVAALLPKAPAGWKAQKAKAKVAGAGLLGGGLEASRDYIKTGGGRVRIQIITDSPMMQSIVQMLSNPMFAKGGDGNKLIRFKGHKALLQDKGKRATMQALLGGKSLMKVTVSGLEGAAGEAKRFAGLVDMDKLEELTR